MTGDFLTIDRANELLFVLLNICVPLASGRNTPAFQTCKECLSEDQDLYIVTPPASGQGSGSFRSAAFRRRGLIEQGEHAQRVRNAIQFPALVGKFRIKFPPPLREILASTLHAIWNLEPIGLEDCRLINVMPRGMQSDGHSVIQSERTFRYRTLLRYSKSRYLLRRTQYFA